MPFGQVAIFGPGLIGGSIAMALRSHSPKARISVWSRSERDLREVSTRGLADNVSTDTAEAVRGADLVVLCTPVQAMKDLAISFAPHLDDTTVVTDTGSVKVCVVDQLEPILGGKFVGSHPMTGSERSGIGAARENLFSGAPCLITPTEETDPEALRTVSTFWTLLGSRITTLSPQEHDHLVAHVSHLPHALAFILVDLVASSLPADSALLAGGSFRDATRVAASDPSLWAGILIENRDEVSKALREMSGRLLSLASTLEQEKADSILDFLTKAKEHRDSLPLPSPDETI